MKNTTLIENLSLLASVCLFKNVFGHQHLAMFAKMGRFNRDV